MTGLLSRLVGISCRFPLAVLLLALALAIGSGFYAADTLGINTDTSKLLSPDLPWQKQSAAFDAAFPKSNKTATIVIDGSSADAVEAGTAALSTALEKRPDMFHSVRRPDSGPYFNKYGLLFLSKDELSKLSDQLADAQPLMGPLDADPTLRGLFGVFGQALDGVADGQAGASDVQRLAVPLARMATATQSVNEGHPRPLDWGSLMTGEAPKPEELRHFIEVQPKLDYSAIEPGAKADDTIRQIARDLGLEAKGLRIRLTGGVPLEDEEFASVSEGTGTATVLSLAAVVLILLLGLRAPRLILSILLTLAAGLVLTAGLAAVLVGTLNMLSVAFAVLFIGIGVDFGIQFAMRYRAELHELVGTSVANIDRSKGRRGFNDEALRRTARAISAPLGLAALATAVGFFSFLPTDYRGVSELGLIAGASMVVALIANLTILPALLSLMPGKAQAEAPGFAWAAPIDRFLARRAKLVVAIAGLLAVAALACTPWVRFDADPLNIKDPAKESVQTAQELTNNPLASPYSIDVLRPNLDTAKALASKLNDLPGVRHAVTLASFVPTGQQEKLEILDNTKLLLGPLLTHGVSLPSPTPEQDRQAVTAFLPKLKSFLAGPQGAALGQGGPAFATALERFLGETKDADARTALLESVLVGGFEPRMEMLRTAMQAGPVTLSDIPDSISEDWVASDGRARVSVFPSGDMKNPKALAAFVDTIRKLVPDATGAPISILESGRTVSHAFVEASLLAVIGITLALALVLRRFRDVVLVLIPLLLAGLYALGTSVAIGMPFNYANVVAVPLLLGIGVAFDIYFVTAWRRSTGPVALLQTSTARAVVFSAFTTTTAFGTLAMSHHVGTASLGLLLMIALGYVLVCTLIVQPAVMTVWGRGRGQM